MTIQYHHDIEQGTEEWLTMRQGILTASTMNKILTPAKLEPSKGKTVTEFCDHLISEQITNEVEDHFQSYEMMRGSEQEVIFRDLYSEHYAPVTECGFITNDKLGFTIGYSPDGLVGDVGSIEGKSRNRKYAIGTVIDNVLPNDYRLQCQTGLWVSEREWMDFISYSNGMRMAVIEIE